MTAGTTIKNSEDGIAFRTPGPSQFYPVFTDTAVSGMTEQIGENFRSNRIEISIEEGLELAMFEEFLARHVQPNKIFSVQCMLLWSEWVRNFRRMSHRFPNLIHEKEFCSVIMDKFGVEIAYEDYRGAVYPGIRFVP